jgi:modulator of FtsH protease
MDAYTLASWKDFFIATSGASAAFAGLLFVGLSINLARIIALPGIADRAGGTLILLGGVLIASVLGLVPQPSSAFGIELLCVGSIVWIVATTLDAQAIRHHYYDTTYHGFQRVLFSQLATLPLIIGAALFLMHTGGGLYWMIPALIVPLLVSMFNAWVLLVEILR